MGKSKSIFKASIQVVLNLKTSPIEIVYKRINYSTVKTCLHPLKIRTILLIKTLNLINCLIRHVAP